MEKMNLFNVPIKSYSVLRNGRLIINGGVYAPHYSSSEFEQCSCSCEDCITDFGHSEDCLKGSPVLLGYIYMCEYVVKDKPSMAKPFMNIVYKTMIERGTPCSSFIPRGGRK